MTPRDLAPIVLIPGVVAALVVLVRARLAPIAVALGVGLGALWLGVTPTIPAEVSDWIWPVAVVGAGLAFAPDRAVRWAWPVLWVAALYGVLRAPLTYTWSVPVGVAAVGLGTVVAAAVCVGARVVAGPGAGGVGYLALVAGGASVALAGSGSLKIGLLASALAGALGGVAVAALRRGTPPERAAEAGIPVLLLLILGGVVYAALPAWVGAWFAVAPLGVAVERWDQGRFPWRSALAGVAVGGLGAVAALVASPPLDL